MNAREWQELKVRFGRELGPGWATPAVIACDAAAIAGSWALRGAGGFVAGAAALALLSLALLHAYLLLHEATHGAASRRRALNDAVGHVCGWLILMPYLTRRRSHLLHHMWTGHPEGDPANRRIIQRFAVLTPDQGRKLERIWRSWLPLLTLNDRIGMWREPYAQRVRGAASQRFAKEIRANRLYFAGYAILLTGLGLSGHLGAFLAWYASAALIQLVLEELANLPHHAETPLLDADESALPYWEQHRVTHGCRSVPVWSSLVLLNFNRHVAHHAFPWVPWHGLPAVHRELRGKVPGLELETPTELAWSLANRRRPLLEIMGHYFDRIPETGRASGRNDRVDSLNDGIHVVGLHEHAAHFTGEPADQVGIERATGYQDRGRSLPTA